MSHRYAVSLSKCISALTVAELPPRFPGAGKSRGRIRALIFVLGLACTLLMIAFLVRLKAHAESANPVAVVTVDAASYQPTLSANGIASAFGTQLATQTVIATDADPNTPGIQLPTSLGGTTVEINGVRAGLFFVSAGQINFLIPAGVASGTASVVVRSGDGVVSQGTLAIATAAPTIFTSTQSGSGAAAALVTSDGVNFELVSNSNGGTRPVQPGQYLILFGTGVRNAASGSVHVLIGGIDSTVTFAGAQPNFVGLDQINCQIPSSLSGRGVVDVVVTIGPVTSNTVNIEMTGTSSGTTPPAVSGFNVESALAGQTITIQGSNFLPDPAQNRVRIGSMEARVTQATANQLTVVIPFGVSTGQVKVETGQGEGQSNANLTIRTSISGTVQSTTGSALQGVTVRLSGTSKVATSNDQGLFLMSDVPTGAAVLEMDGGTVSSTPPYPSVILKTVVSANRDNQLSQPVSLQQATGSSTSVGGRAGASSAPKDGTRANAKRMTPAAVQVTTNGVTLDIPGTVNFPNGSTSGIIALTLVQRSLLPVALPPKVFSSTIVQITPFDATFSPAANLTFPNSDSLAPGTVVDLYAYDNTITPSGFAKRGTAQVSADGLTIVGTGVIDRASIWLAAQAQIQTTTVKGTILSADGNPVRNARAQVRGRSATSDGNGAFAISDVPVRANEQLTVDVTHTSATGRRLTATATATAVVGGVTDVGTVRLPAEPALVFTLSPNSVVLKPGLSATLQISATLPAPTGGYVFNLVSSDPATTTVGAQSVTILEGALTASFTVSGVNPGKALVGAKLTDNSGGAAASVLVNRPAPVLSAISPGSGPTSTQVTINGTGFSLNLRQNLVAFEQGGQIILASPDSTKVINATTAPALVAKVPPLGSGPALVSVVSLDSNGVPSEPSNKLTFNVTGAPQIASISPNPAAVGSEVTITGTGFSPNLAENAVLFTVPYLIIPGSTQPVYAHGKVTSATDTELHVRVPGYAGSGPVIVVRNPARSLNQDAGLARLDAVGGAASSLFLNFAVTPAANYVATAAIFTPGAPYYEVSNSIAATPTRLVASNSSSNQVLLYDISTANAANPLSLATLNVNGQSPLGVAASGNLAVVGLAPPFSAGSPQQPIGPAQLIDLNNNSLSGLLTLPATFGFDVQVALAGNTALVATGGTIYTFDVSNPSSPIKVGSLALGSQINALAADGSLAIASLGSQLAVIDISSPAAPALKSTVSDFSAVYTGTLSFNLSSYIDISAVTLRGTTAAISVSGLIVTLDLGAPTAPKVLGSAGLNFYAQSLAINGSTLIANSEDAGVMLLDISAPDQPFTVSFYDTPGEVLGVASIGNFIYTNESLGSSSNSAQGPNGEIAAIQFAGTLPVASVPKFEVFPKTPVSAGEMITIRGFNLGNGPSDLSVMIDGLPATVVYANPTSYIPTTNITEVTVQVPTNLQPSGSIVPFNLQVNYGSSSAGVGSRLSVNQGGPLKRLKSFNTGTPGIKALTKIGTGPYVAVVEPHTGISIINTNTGDVAARVTVGQLHAAPIINQFGYARLNQTDYLVVFGFSPYTHSAGLSLVNVSNPAKPFVASETSVAIVAGSGQPPRATLASSGANQPQGGGASSITFDEHISNLVVSGTTAYVHTDVLNVIDLSNPSAPVFKGVYKPVSAAGVVEHTSGVAVTGTGTVALTTFEGTIHLLNATDPANIQVLGKYVAPPPTQFMPPASFNSAVAFLSSSVVVAASESDSNLYFVDFSAPASPTLKSTLQAHARGFALDSTAGQLILAGEESNPFSASPSSGDLIIVDTSNLAAPRVVAALNTPGSGRGVVVMGTNLYALADGQDSPVGLHLISADPSKFPLP